MITQQHEHEIQQKAQAPSPVKELRWLVVLMSILGVALPLVAGWWTQSPWPMPDSFATDWILAIAVMVGVPVAVGAFLLCFALRTWWVAVFAGIAWFVGQILATVVYPLVEGGWPALQAYQARFWAGEVGIIELVLGPLIVSMMLGAAGALVLRNWRASRQ